MQVTCCQRQGSLFVVVCMFCGLSACMSHLLEHNQLHWHFLSAMWSDHTKMESIKAFMKVSCVKRRRVKKHNLWEESEAAWWWVPSRWDGRRGGKQREVPENRRRGESVKVSVAESKVWKELQTLVRQGACESILQTHPYCLLYSSQWKQSQ